MRKIIIIVTITIILFLTSCSCKSCRKGLDYKYVGAYIKVVKLDKMDLKDGNIQLYFDVEKESFVSHIGVYQYQVKLDQKTKNIKVEDDIHKYDFSGAYSIKGDLEEVEIYPIVYTVDKKYKILTDDKTVLKLKDNETVSKTLYEYFIFEKEQYDFKMILKFYKKEGI